LKSKRQLGYTRPLAVATLTTLPTCGDTPGAVEPL
jgi:hypothetical protein